MSASTVDAVAQLAQLELDDRYKGIPLGARLTLGDLGRQRWNVARGDLALPVVTLRESALANNIDAMARYCARHGAALAPHGKTTMAPQLFRRQLDAGAWGITAGTPSQAAVMRRFGVRRILIANEIVEPDAMRWIATEMAADPAVEILSLVDDVATVEAFDAALRGLAPTRRVPVLVESGIAGGRAGTRRAVDAVAVATAVAGSAALTLAGVETYEGLVASTIDDAALAAIDSALADVRALVYDLAQRDVFGRDEIIVTAGGSAYFDRVVEAFADWSGLGRAVQVVLRSGCYVTHDAGKYRRMSPLDGRRPPHEHDHLVNALEGWGRVLSAPEPGLVIAGIGKRDLSYDIELPFPLTLRRAAGGTRVELAGQAVVEKLMDQHAFVRIDDAVGARPGDIITFGVSHPCTTFDKTALMPVIDDDDTVIDAVVTFF